VSISCWIYRISHLRMREFLEILRRQWLLLSMAMSTPSAPKNAFPPSCPKLFDKLFYPVGNTSPPLPHKALQQAFSTPSVTHSTSPPPQALPSTSLLSFSFPSSSLTSPLFFSFLFLFFFDILATVSYQSRSSLCCFYPRPQFRGFASTFPRFVHAPYVPPTRLITISQIQLTSKHNLNI